MDNWIQIKQTDNVNCIIAKLKLNYFLYDQIQDQQKFIWHLGEVIYYCKTGN